MTLALTDVPVHCEGAEGSRFGQEFVVLDPAGRMLRGLNETGARIWALIDGKRSVGEIAEEISKEFEVEITIAQRDTAAFLSMLADRGLVASRPKAERESGSREGK